MASNIIFPPKPAAKPALRTARCELCAASHFPAESVDGGECRHEPPKMQFAPVQGKLGQVSLTAVSGWPGIQRDHFCITGYTPKLAEVFPCLPRPHTVESPESE